VIYEPIFDSGFVAVEVTSVISETISDPSRFVSVVSGATSVVVSETFFDPSGFVMVVVCVVVIVPSGLRVFVVTSAAVGVTGMAVAIPSLTSAGELRTGSGLFFKARVVQPAPTHKMEAMMHRIPAVSMLQSSASLQISEARAT
jgi:hypothetical protein